MTRHLHAPHTSSTLSVTDDGVQVPPTQLTLTNFTNKDGRMAYYIEFNTLTKQEIPICIIPSVYVRDDVIFDSVAQILVWGRSFGGAVLPPPLLSWAM